MMGTKARSRLAADLAPRFAAGGYVPHVPHPPQQAFLWLDFKAEVFYGGAAGGGKALGLDVLIPTPTGWTTMADVAVGDVVLDETGTPVPVLAKSGVMADHEVVRVVFSDGTSVLCDAEHRWTTLSEGDRERASRSDEDYRAARRAGRPSRGRGSRPHVAAVNSARAAIVRATATLVASPWTFAVTRTAADLRGDLAAGHRPHAVPLAAPLQLPVAALPVDPYVLGVWLGDGDTRRPYVTIGVEDQEEMLARFAAAGHPLTAAKGRGMHFKAGGDLGAGLRALGLLGPVRTPTAKFLPASYLRGSLEQRLALLQGIVDSDGHVDGRGQVEVTWTSRPLTDGLLELLATLGIKATAREGRARIAGRDCGPKWSIKWLSELPCARLTRKAARQKREGFRGTHAVRYVVAVEAAESVPVQCITVGSASGLFLAGPQMVPTHNSDAGLMAALQYVDVPGYSALIIRRTFADLSLPGAIMERAGHWLEGTAAKKRDGGKLWEFPTSGRPATLQFGYAQTHADVLRYQGAEFQCVFVDELTHFEERTYRYLFSRLRGPALPCVECGHQTSQPAGQGRQHDEGHDLCACGHEHQPSVACDALADRGGLCGCEDYRPAGCPCLLPVPDREARDELGVPILGAAPDGTTLADVPLRMRSGSNPGGLGHVWVRDRFINARTKEPAAVFVPAKLEDNPSLDRKAYRAGLGMLTEVERARLEDGDWDVADDGDVFQREWFSTFVDEVPASGVRWCRFWDFAATVEKVAKRRHDPDWTVGTLAGIDQFGLWWVRDVIRFRKAPADTELMVKQTAAVDGRGVMVRWEEEGGSSGKTVTDHYRRMVLPGFDADGIRPSLSKVERAAPVARAAQVGNVRLVSGAWNRVWLDEFAGFPNVAHDDQVDSLSGVFDSLTLQSRSRIIA